MPPTPQELAANLGIDLANIQGDILLRGMPKKSEIFYFVNIVDPRAFAQKLPQINVASSTKVVGDRARMNAAKAEATRKGVEHGRVPMASLNIAFSMRGLRKLDAISGLVETNKLASSFGVFSKGMLNDRGDLGDPDWRNKDFSGADIDAVLIVAGSDQELCQKTLNETLALFNSPETSSIGRPILRRVVKEIGRVRPGEGDGKEHFGFEDGISQPQVKGLDDIFDQSTPGAFVNTVKLDTVLVRHESTSDARPAWMQDGSFLVFRKLEQDVSAWNKFVHDKAIALGIGADLLGAKLVGRWKSGRPVQLASGPSEDDRVHPLENDFTFKPNIMDKCPFGAHIRKTNPRGDPNFFGPRIMRRGISYGEDFVDDKTTPDTDRGLLFACYQSDIDRGYRFIQRFWANNPNFPEGKTGLDTLVAGQRVGTAAATDDLKIQINPGADGANTSISADRVNQFVTPRGGEYFFSPSISALKTVLSAVRPGPRPLL